MSSESAGRVTVRNVWKTFRFYRHPLHRFTSWLTGGRHGRPTEFHALRGVSFEIPRGSSVGIVGVNGAGKSTLLKIITGTLEPTSGSVTLQGRVASLLELGTGFHPLFTGRQNVFYNARFLGLSDAEIRERLPAIEAFSELGEFFDRPLRTYSSGMQVRLAFSVAASVDPEVLIIDEVLAVGDVYFQQKCTARIREFRDRGLTILLVSHDPAAVKTLCDRALLLHEGEIADDRTPAAVLERYNAVTVRKRAELDYFAAAPARGVAVGRTGTLDALVADVELLGLDDVPARALLAGSLVTIRVRVHFFTPLKEPTVGILIRDRLGNDSYGTNTFYQHIPMGIWAAGETMEVRFHMALDLGPGEYSLTVAVHSFAVHLLDSYDWLDAALVFRVLPADDRGAIGIAHLRPVIETTRVPEAPVNEVLARALGELPATLDLGSNATDLLRTGWHATEGSGPNAFRWTEAECTFLLQLIGSVLRFEVGVTRPPGAPPTAVRVICLGREVGEISVSPQPEWQIVSLTLPGDLPRGPAHVRLVVRDSWRPAASGAGDNRVLGVRLRRVWSAG